MADEVVAKLEEKNKERFQQTRAAAKRIIPLFIEVSPNFQSEYQTLESQWDIKELDRSPFIKMSALAKYIVDLLNRNETQDFPKIFKLVEDILSEEDRGSRELIVIGLLEDIQNQLSHPFRERKAQNPELNQILKIMSRNNNIKDDRLMKWLGPETKKSWEELNKFWDKVIDAKSKGLI